MVSTSARSHGPDLTDALRMKICGITRPQDAMIAEEAGASFVGVVLVPDTPRFVSARRAAEIASSVEVPVVAVLTERRPDVIAELAREVGAGVVQLHGENDPATFRELRRSGGWELWGVARVRSGDEALRTARELEGAADLLLLDGWHPERIGGTGRPFPWSEVELLREEWPTGLGLGAAGGLDPANVGEAVARLRPHLVDVSSGVEARPGIKDPRLVMSFLENARAAGRRVGCTDRPGDSRPPSPPE